MTEPAALLNAYLDDELTDVERQALEVALAESVDLKHELGELRATRSLLRGLPEVEPRRPITIAPKRGVVAPARAGSRRLALAVTGVAAVWLVVLSVGVSLGSLPVVPEIDQLAVQHASASTTDSEFLPMTIGQMADDPAVFDDIGQGMNREAIFQSGDLVHVRYSDGNHAVSIFHQQGEVAWDDMPNSGEVSMMDDGPIWTSSMDGFDVLVTQRGDLVVTVVADGDMDNEMTMSTSAMVPPVEMGQSLLDRVIDAPGNVLDRF